MITWLEHLLHSENALQALGLLLDAALKGALILALAGVVTALLRRGSAATRHLVWGLALGSLLTLPVLSLLLPAWQVPLLPAPAVVAEVPPAPEAPWSPAPVPAPMSEPMPAPMPATAPAPPVQATPALPSAPSTRAADAAIEMSDASALPEWLTAARLPSGAAAYAGELLDRVLDPFRGLSWTAWLWIVWLAGALMVLMQLGAGRLAVWRLRRRARPVPEGPWTALSDEVGRRLGLQRHVELLQSARVSTPMTWGVRRPVVVLPAEASSWSAAQRRCVLLHELGHVRRRDTLTQAVAQVAAAFYWFNPLVWAALHHLRVEREQACDDLVLTHGTRPSEYAGYLLDIARNVRKTFVAPLGTVAMAQPSQLEGRVVAILDPHRRRRAPGRLAAATSVGLAIAMIVPLAAFTPWVDSEASPPRGASASATPDANALLSDPSAWDDDFTWSEVMASGQTLEVRGILGDIRATASADDRAVVTARQHTSAFQEKLEVQVVRRAEGVLVCAVYPGNDGGRPDPCSAASGGDNWQNHNVEVAFTVHVPEGVHFVGRTVEGNIIATGLSGNVDAVTVDGDVEVRTRGWARATTVDGSIYAEMGRADWSGELAFQTVDGDVFLLLPEAVSAELALRVDADGEIASAYPLEARGGMHRIEASGRVGAGGRYLTARTVDGDIRVGGLGSDVKRLQRLGTTEDWEDDGDWEGDGDWEDDSDWEDDGDWEDKRALNELHAALGAASGGDRRRATYALGEEGDRESIPALSRVLRDDSDAEVRAMAAWSLGEIGHRDATDALVGALGDAAPRVRAMVAWALGEIEDPASVPGLSARLAKESDAEVRGKIVWALGEIEDPRAVPALAGALKDTDRQTRSMAAWSLGELEDVRAVDALVSALGDEEEDVRLKAAYALGEIGDARAVEALSSALRKDRSPAVRAKAAYALAEIEDAGAVDALIQALREDRSADVRAMAAYALGEIGDVRAAEALRAALEDENAEVRRKAAWALGEITDEKKGRRSGNGMKVKVKSSGGGLAWEGKAEEMSGQVVRALSGVLQQLEAVDVQIDRRTVERGLQESLRHLDLKKLEIEARALEASVRGALVLTPRPGEPLDAACKEKEKDRRHGV